MEIIQTTLFSLTIIIWIIFPITTILYILNDKDIPSNHLNN